MTDLATEGRHMLLQPIHPYLGEQATVRAAYSAAYTDDPDLPTVLAALGLGVAG